MDLDLLPLDPTSANYSAQVVGIRVEGGGTNMVFDSISVRNIVATHSNGTSMIALRGMRDMRTSFESRSTVRRLWGDFWCDGLSAGGDNDHPVDAESVGQHAEGIAPELFSQGHINLATGGQAVEVVRQRRRVAALQAQVDVVTEHDLQVGPSIACK